MDDRLLREKAVAYEALVSYYGGDGEKAWKTLSLLDADYSVPFASYTRDITSSPEEEARFNEIWRLVRASFDQSKIDFRITGYSSEDVHFLYLAGKTELLTTRKLVFLGAVMPSLQGRSDTARTVIEAVKCGYTIAAPFDSGLGPYALSVALGENGNTIAVLPSSLSKCPNGNLLLLMERIYEKGLLLSQFSPAVKYEKWHVVLRNRFLASFGDAFYMAEEKDGGPGWAVFDSALANGKKCFLSSGIISNPNYGWCRNRLERGALELRRKSEIRTIFSSPGRRREKKTPSQEPSLFPPGTLDER